MVPKSGLTHFLDIFSIIQLMSFKMALSRVKASTRASKWGQNDPQAQKQLQILKAHTFTFPMIYSKSIYEKVDFLLFLMYELQNGFKIGDISPY